MKKGVLILIGVMVLLILLINTVSASDDNQDEEEKGFLNALKKFFSFRWLIGEPITMLGGVGDPCPPDCDEGLYCNELGICDDTISLVDCDGTPQILPSQYILNVAGTKKGSFPMGGLCDGCSNLDGTFELNYAGEGEVNGGRYDYWYSEETFTVEGGGLMCDDISGLPGNYRHVEAVRYVLLITNGCGAFLKLIGTDRDPLYTPGAYVPYATWEDSDDCGGFFLSGKTDFCDAGKVSYHCFYTSAPSGPCEGRISNPGVMNIRESGSDDVYSCGCGDGVVQTGEGCDDGNHESGDGCSNICEIEICQSDADCTDPANPACDIPNGDCVECTGDNHCSDPTPVCDTANKVCVSGPCTQDCSGIDCGNDPICGLSCGICTPPDNCVNGLCLCLLDCIGKDCGGDGCGGSCGTCPDGQNCENGVCKSGGGGPCICSGCGSCGGTCSGNCLNPNGEPKPCQKCKKGDNNKHSCVYDDTIPGCGPCIPKWVVKKTGPWSECKPIV